MGPSRSCWNGTSKGTRVLVCTFNKSVHTKKLWKLIEGTLYLLAWCLSGFPLPLKVFLLLSIPLSRFSWLLWRTLSNISFICGNLLSSFEDQYHGPFYNQSTSWQQSSVSLCFIWICADKYTVNRLFALFPCDMLSILQQTIRGIRESNRSLLWYVWSIFSTLKVDALLGYSCL